MMLASVIATMAQTGEILLIAKSCEGRFLPRHAMGVDRWHRELATDGRCEIHLKIVASKETGERDSIKAARAI